MALTKLLELLGHRLDSVANAAAATDVAAHKHFDLVISDLGLPDRDGYDLMKQLRREHQLPGIAVSGFGMEHDRVRSKDAGFAVHMIKPITIDALSEAIDSIVSGGFPA